MNFKVELIFIFLFLIIISSSGQLIEISNEIVVDQFGYRNESTKIAVVRDPQVGFDADINYLPGNEFLLVNASSNEIVFSGQLTQWNGGNTDAASGDKIWWFDFSEITENGVFYVSDETENKRSYDFVISNHVYDDLLKTAFKTFFYQRAGFAKQAPFAGEGWQDAASHLGPLQDANCRQFNDPSNSSTEKDLSGGWYDAGDYNKYTSWAANYIITMLRMFKERPEIWTDDFGIPESGNGISDMLDEIKWGMDWLLKMQQDDGGSLSVMGLDASSPPSAATGPSYYGPKTANATWKSSAAFAIGAKCFRAADPDLFESYADSLEARAIAAWSWAGQNPSSQFANNSWSTNSLGLGAGNQETDSLGRFFAKMSSALYLYDLTLEPQYLTVFENGISDFPLIAWNNYLSQYFQESQNLLFHYLTLSDINEQLANQIRAATLAATMGPGDFSAALLNQLDPYRAFIDDYNWGSNQYKSDYGNYFLRLRESNIDAANNEQYTIAAEDYLHYIHGVNPLQLVYLSHTGDIGGDNHLMEFYHSWFSNGSALWDREGISTYGPAPGFLSGGPNEFYEVDGCCPNDCGSAENNALCNAESVSPPLNQPPMKSYKDFNTSWPLNSWQITENSNGYQVAYLSLLSKFAELETGVDIQEKTTIDQKLLIYPNPASEKISLSIKGWNGNLFAEIFDIHGNLVRSEKLAPGASLNIKNLCHGVYFVKATAGEKHYISKLVQL